MGLPNQKHYESTLVTTDPTSVSSTVSMMQKPRKKLQDGPPKHHEEVYVGLSIY